MSTYSGHSGRSGFSATRVQHNKPKLNNPDVLLARDSTVLNLLHRQYAKDPHDELVEAVKAKKETEEVIEKLIKAPFRMSAEEYAEITSRWAGKKMPFPLVIKQSYRKNKTDEVLTEQVRTSMAGSATRTTGKEKHDDEVEDEESAVPNYEHHSSPLDAKMKGLSFQDEGNKNMPSAADIGLVRDYVAVHKKYLVVNFNYYLNCQNFHYPAEFALSEFSVQHGLGHTISGLIDMDTIPLGYNSDVRDGIQKICVPFPGYNKDFSPYRDVLGPIETFCRKHFTPGETILFFTLKEHIPIVRDGLQWLIEASDQEFGCSYKILPFSVLVQILANESQELPYRAPQNKEPTHFVADECYLDSYLHKGEHKYMPELACQHHAKEVNQLGISKCPQNKVKRLVFNASQVLLSLYNIPPLLHFHYPIKTFIKTRLPLMVAEDEGNLNYSCDSSSDAGSQSTANFSGRTRASFSRASSSRTASSIGTTSGNSQQNRAHSSTTTGDEQEEEEEDGLDFYVAGPGWNQADVLNQFQIRKESYGKGPTDEHDMRRCESETTESDEDDDSFSDTASVDSSTSSESYFNFKK